MFFDVGYMGWDLFVIGMPYIFMRILQKIFFFCGTRGIFLEKIQNLLPQKEAITRNADVCISEERMRVFRILWFLNLICKGFSW